MPRRPPAALIGALLTRLFRQQSTDAEVDAKKPRRSDRISSRVGSSFATEASAVTEIATPRTPAAAPPGARDRDNDNQNQKQNQKQNQLPTPLTFLAVDDSSASEQRFKEPTATPPGGRPSQVAPRAGSSGSGNNNVGGSGDEAGSYSSPPQDTQAMPSQYIDPNAALSDEVKDEVKEGVWGYLLPLGARYGSRSIVMKKRVGCEDSDSPSSSSKKKGGKKGGASNGADHPSSKGYLVGRHPECDVVIDDPIVSNRHCLIFAEHKGHDTVAVIEDLSSNGTFVNEALVGRNQRRELQEKDEIAVLDKARFVFRYPKARTTSGFHQQYSLQNRLGKGHFAEVYLCVEKATGQRFAVKIFTKTPGVEDRSKTDGLQQEIAVLMGVNHPSVLCLKDTFNEKSAVYLVLELASEGELFNFIVLNSKLSESDTRKLFKQLFAGVKYLHERNIVHRDIKPENILLVDRDLHVKLADFGLAKIIGEESFTTTLCGTPSYVAPEILADTRHRKYTKAVDIWSLGVVLYICLCGFPPFSDELRSPDFPFNMSQQIRSGRFTFPSPYWDSVGDPALDLIDSMLVVDPERRFTIDQCMAHPWMNETALNANDSTDGLVGGVAGLAVNRRGLVRERTLISALNRVEITKIPGGANHDPIKIFSKNPTGAGHNGHSHGNGKEARPADNADPGAFMEHGDKGDPSLFGDEGSAYSKADVAATKSKGKGKSKR
ncbi:serine/threonineeeee-protein kinase Chk2 [Sporothrix schenckii 1099-18]|uniref:Serine/threonineeeee-protein kinase Chk2 n=1 Tax=Sporothrix schenckii 1099-18 TaxID=1397361 RepID=A0A0F2MNJ3_SPOSC|nr:serine/threonineeeee-protein kinase Chk2 [Sporothrix schenckii 1099-18]KJR89751.1 serine/threonineeeee-protein kinase Chk2 [Sporothrix schenckii 1099-18]